MPEKPHYIYFNIRGRGELPRLVCAAAEIDFIDERIESVDWVSELMSKTPFGQLPILKVDGQIYAQKLAISLYLARLGGLYPTTASEADLLKLEHALLFVEEVLENYVSAQVQKHYQNKSDLLEKVKTEIFPHKLPMMEKLLQDNGTGYYVGNQLTIVDLSAFDVIEHVVDVMGKTYLSAFPLIKANFIKVGQVKGVKEYIDNRPAITTHDW